MRPFAHALPPDLEAALHLLGDDWSTRLIAGGTDLLTEMQDNVVAPERLVSLQEVGALRYLGEVPGFGLSIGALVTLDRLQRDEVVQQSYPLLAQAVAAAASPQLRNAGSIGGNLCQTSRCWYYRGDFPCWLKGGENCFAYAGDNRYHALFGDGPCFSAHPSDPAPALLALEARVRLVRRGGERTPTLDDFYRLPAEGRRRVNDLRPDEVLAEVVVPQPAAGARGVYLKAMERRAWSFALVSIALQTVWEGDRIVSARAAASGVAPIPWRLQTVEEALTGQTYAEALPAAAGEAATAGARPLTHNRYKLSLLRALTERAVRQVGGAGAAAS